MSKKQKLDKAANLFFHNCTASMDGIERHYLDKTIQKEDLIAAVEEELLAEVQQYVNLLKEALL